MADWDRRFIGWYMVPNFSEQIPEMVRNGEFTPTAVAPQSLACVLFLAAMGRFLLDYQRSGRLEDALLREPCPPLRYGRVRIHVLDSMGQSLVVLACFTPYG